MNVYRYKFVNYYILKQINESEFRRFGSNIHVYFRQFRTELIRLKYVGLE